MKPAPSEPAGRCPAPQRAAAESAPRELPAALRPFEAALGSMTPRAGRLDYDLVMFRAGQLSATGGEKDPHHASGGRRGKGTLAWPAAFAGMTAFAAALLGLLVARPVVEHIRVVRVRAVSGSDEAATGAVGSPRSSQPFQKSLRPGDLPSHLSGDWIPRPLPSDLGLRQPGAGDDRLYARAVGMDVLDRMLREGADPWTVPASPSAGPATRPAPVPYRQRLRTLLDDQPSGQPDRATVDAIPTGANT